LTTVPLTYATKYYVSVQTIVNIDGQDYASGFGTACEITTPDFPTVGLQASQCGDDVTPYLVPSTSTEITAEFVSGASYRFILQRLVGGLPVGEPLSLTRPVNNFTLYQVAGVVAEG
ncbi:hypothetical protein ACSVH2_14130, partial [Flavobacterium sp. RSB2_4_14]|uniref:hypothetical protein n=1 Tax=Flavobacterium sp. RSB2_4_14 TaxID=3447665 RepID=UPI003F3670C9